MCHDTHTCISVLCVCGVCVCVVWLLEQARSVGPVVSQTRSVGMSVRFAQATANVMGHQTSAELNALATSSADGAAPSAEATANATEHPSDT